MKRRMMRALALVMCLSMLLTSFGALAEDFAPAPSATPNVTATEAPSEAPEEAGDDLTGQLPAEPEEPGDDADAESPVEPEEPGDEADAEAPTEPEEAGDEADAEAPVEPEEPGDEASGETAGGEELPADESVEPASEEPEVAKVDTTCTHVNGEVVRKKRMIGFASCTPTEHVIRYQPYDEVLCALCGAVIMAEDAGKPVEEAGPHTFIYGQCTECSYNCLHDGVEATGEEEEGGAEREVNAQQHRYFVRYSKAYENCPYHCGGEQMFLESTPWEDHTFDEDGRCTECYFTLKAATCTHPNATREVYRAHLSYYADGMTCVGVDPYVYYNINPACPDCGFRGEYFGEFLEGEEERMEHNFVYGTCYRCGYNSCTHEHCYEIGRSAMSLSAGEKWEPNGKVHTGDGVVKVEYRCFDCDARFEVEERDYIEEEHSFGADGVTCTECGMTCEHSFPAEPSSDEIQYFETTCEPLDASDPDYAKYHRIVSGKAARTEIYVCEDCGYNKVVETQIDHVENVLVKHDWHRNCVDCGISRQCGSHSYEDVVRESKVIGIAPNDQETHTIYRQNAVDMVCSVCLYTMPYGHKYVQESEPHDFDEDGLCIACGYQRDDLHPKHEHAAGKIVRKKRQLYIANCTPTEHVYRCQPYEEVYCATCGALIEVRDVGDPVDEGAAHSFDAGRCSVCWYYCEHDGLEPSGEKTAHTLDFNVNARQHQAIHGYLTGYDSCPYHCGASLETLEPAAWEDHDFDENGKCTVCGRIREQAACTHPNANIIVIMDGGSRFYADGMTCVRVDPFEVTFITRDEPCPDCGYSGEVGVEVRLGEEVREEHVFSEGRCMLCGYNQCQHEFSVKVSETNVSIAPGATWSVLWDSHGAMGVKRTKYRCLDCEMEYEVEESCRIYEPHIYGADGITCTVCGGVCDHEYDEEPVRVEYVYTKNVKYESLPEGDPNYFKQHRVTGEAVKRETYVCHYCDAEKVVETSVGERSELQSHDNYTGLLSSGGSDKPVGKYGYICAQCGAQNDQCTPFTHLLDSVESSEFSSEPFETRSIDENRHVAYYEGVKREECAVCGEIQDERKIYSRKEEPHRFDTENVCEICGYEGNPLHAQHKHEAGEVERKMRKLFVVNCTPTEHVYSCQPYDEVRCATCGAIIDVRDVGEPVEQTSEHQFRYGRCRTCRYTCLHDGLAPEGRKQIYASYWNVNERQHQNVRIYDTDCENCPYNCGGEGTSYEIDPWEDHEFDERGACVDCGQRREWAACTHPRAEIDVTEGWVYAYPDGMTCVYVDPSDEYYIDRKNPCPDCGYWGLTRIDVHLGEERRAEHQFFHGSCENCGYNQCQHEDSYEVSRTEVSIAPGETWTSGWKAHRAKGVVEVEYYCLICDATFKVTETDFLVEPHTFGEDGSACTVCGMECPHYYREAPDRVEYEFVDDGTCEPLAKDDPNFYKQHRVSGEVVKREIYECCNFCGREEVVETPVGYRSELRAHDWLGSNRPYTCRTCGLVNEICTGNQRHDNQDVEVSSRVVLAKQIDEATHEVYIEVLYNRQCSVCGYVRFQDTDYRHEVVSHEFDENHVCSVCGYRLDPLHPQHEHTAGETVQKKRVLYAVSNTPKEHVMRCQPYVEVRCATCGAVIDTWDEGETVDEASAHVFHDGYCDVCGYACQHDGVKLEGEKFGSTKDCSITATQHQIVRGYKLAVENCPYNCGAEEQMFDVYPWEDHNFVDGKCTECKVTPEQATCTHPNGKYFETNSYRDYRPSADGSKCIGVDPIHIRMHYKNEYGCPDCGFQGDIICDVQEGVEVLMEHEFVDGRCRHCGYKACTHPHRYAVATENAGILAGEKWQADGTAHNAAGLLRIKYCCYDCGEEFEEIRRSMISEPHSFDAEGKCSVCGLDCPHEFPAKPARTERVYGSGVTYEPLPETEEGHLRNHKVSGAAVDREIYVCELCGYEKAVDAQLGVQSGFLPHDWVWNEAIYEDVCSLCGLVNSEAYHSVNELLLSTDTVQLEPIDAENHTAFLVNHYVWLCEECGLLGYENDEDPYEDRYVKETQPHKFDEYGICACGYRLYEDPIHPQHAHKVGRTEQKKTQMSIVSCSPTEHVIRYMTSVEEYCLYCGALIRVQLDDVVEEATAHNFEYGACVDCSYVCRHDGVKPEGKEWNDDLTWRTIGATQHQLTTIHTVGVDNCPYHCGGAATVYEIADPEDHNFVNGKCEVCGVTPAQATCAHANAEDVMDYVSYRDYRPGEDGKSCVGVGPIHIKFYRAACPDCGFSGDLIYDAQDEKLEVPLDHWFNDGVCLNCGYKLCAHENVEEVGRTNLSLLPDETWQPDGEVHIAAGTVRIQYRCPDCLASFEYVLNDVLSEPHDFGADGVCTACGCEQEESPLHPKHEHVPEVIDTIQYRELYVVSSDEKEHTIRYQPYQLTVCGECFEYIDTQDVGEPVDQTSDHIFEQGRCADCGYICTHGGMPEDYYDGDILNVDTCYVVNVNENMHKVVYNVDLAITNCPNNCGAIEHVEVRLMTDHAFRSDGTCIICERTKEQMKCIHAEADFKYNVLGYRSYEADGMNCIGISPRVVAYLETPCPDCGFVGDVSYEVYEGIAGEPMEHEFDDNGFCVNCGYSLCRHEAKYLVSWENLSIAPGEEWKPAGSAHIATGMATFRQRCFDCGKLFETDMRSVLSEEHVYALSDTRHTKCLVCGQTCDHEDMSWQSSRIVYSDQATFKPCDEEPLTSHYVSDVAPMQEETYVCERCGYVEKRMHPYDSHIEGDLVMHRWDMKNDGTCRCIDCGYVNEICSRDGHKTSMLPAADPAEVFYGAIPLNDSEHTAYLTREMEEVCNICLYLMGTERMPVKEVQPHEFDEDGYCVCGYYRKPATPAKESGEEAAEPSFTLASSAYGVTAEEEIRMGTALAKLVEAAAAEGADVRILGLDELLAGAEYNALQALRPAERAFLALKLMGRDAEIEAAATELEIEISEDAKALYEAVSQRLAAMSEEDWTEFEGLLEKYFPVYEENGASFVQVTLECEGETAELVRMTFTQSGESDANGEGVWLLSQIETA